MRITIFGATGLLGKALTHQWKEPGCGDEVLGLGSSDGDIRDEKRVLELLELSRPDWTILAAAYTDVDGCEANRDLAFNVNLRGAANVARAAKQCGSRLLFLSTDYVFDGTKTTPYTTSDARAPRSVYGQSKADAEIELGRILPDCASSALPGFSAPAENAFLTQFSSWPKAARNSTWWAINEDLRPTWWIWLAPSFSFAARTLPGLCMRLTVANVPGTSLPARSLRTRTYLRSCGKPPATNLCARHRVRSIPYSLPRACRSMKL